VSHGVHDGQVAVGGDGRQVQGRGRAAQHAHAKEELQPERTCDCVVL
jgi:hypothetical protein